MSNALQALSTLERFLAADHLELLADLNPPASESEIHAFESRLKLRFPADFIACYRIHNGQRGRSKRLFQGKEWLSLQNIDLDWSTWEDLQKGGDFKDSPSRPDAQIREGWWRSGWVPFTSDGGGTHICLDLDPAATGTYGQVIKIFHDMPHRQYLAADFGSWLSLQVESITTGL